MATSPKLGRDFNIAVCDHFGLKRVTALKLNHGSDEVLSVSLDIALTADDMAAIAARMGAEQRTTYTYGNTITVNSSCDKDCVQREIAKAVDALHRAGKI